MEEALQSFNADIISDNFGLKDLESSNKSYIGILLTNVFEAFELFNTWWQKFIWLEIYTLQIYK